MDLCITYFVQSFDPKWFQNLMVICNGLDRFEFYALLTAFIWWKYGMRAGLHLFYVLFVSRIVNASLKNLFAMPRPFLEDANVGLVYVEGYGFPSGGAQTAVLLAGLFFLYARKVFPWKKRTFWWVAFGYVGLVSFSRLYLGVHYPVDIVGGWIIGLVLWGGYLNLSGKIERWVKGQSRAKLFWASMGAAAFAMALPPGDFPTAMAQTIWLGAATNAFALVLQKKDLLSR